MGVDVPNYICVQVVTNECYPKASGLTCGVERWRPSLREMARTSALVSKTPRQRTQHSVKSPTEIGTDILGLLSLMAEALGRERFGRGMLRGGVFLNA